MASEATPVKPAETVPDSSIKLLFVEMGVGYDQHGYALICASSSRIDWAWIISIELSNCGNK